VAYSIVSSSSIQQLSIISVPLHLTFLRSISSDFHLTTVIFPGAVTPGVKRLGREADHSHPSSADVKAWLYNSTPAYFLMAWCLIKQLMLLSQTHGKLLPSRSTSLCPVSWAPNISHSFYMSMSLWHFLPTAPEVLDFFLPTHPWRLRFLPRANPPIFFLNWGSNVKIN
jgi:hypothetical protein